MKTRIMLVDDNEELLTTLKEFFASDDTAEIVATAADGEKALEMFERVNPDVLVLDLVMPGIDGFEVMERLDKRECKILVLSALSQDAFVTKAMNLGADYFMRKPANPETLRKRIAELMTAPAAAQGWGTRDSSPRRRFPATDRSNPSSSTCPPCRR